jgi:hypothetical protein
MRARRRTLASVVRDCPLAPGVYCLYRGARLLHVGVAAGAATLRSEVRRHARGEYGPLTQSAERVRWEVSRDALFAYRRFLSLYAASLYAADGARQRQLHLSASRRHSAPARRARRREPQRLPALRLGKLLRP